MKDVGELGEFLNKISPKEKMIRDRAFFSILEGCPTTSNRLHQMTGIPSEQVKTIITKLQQSGLIEVDSESGNVVGSYGLSLIERTHRLNINDHDLFTWCAADAIGIPAALNMDAQIRSECFSCKRQLTIGLTKGKIAYTSEPDVTLWVIEADLGRSIVGCT